MYTNRIPGNSLSDSCQMTPVVALLNHLKKFAHILYIWGPQEWNLLFFSMCILRPPYWNCKTNHKSQFFRLLCHQKCFFFLLSQSSILQHAALFESKVESSINNLYTITITRRWSELIPDLIPSSHSNPSVTPITHHHYLSVLKHVMNKLWHGLPAPAKKKKRCLYSCCPDISQRILGMSQAPIGFLSPLCWE